MFTPQNSAGEKIVLSGFNNLTKILSFNFYDFCIALSDEQKRDYVSYINEKYNAEKIANISKEVCKIIDANILGISVQDYDPVGASTMVLMSDVKGSGCSMHLDKSHITAHTYPDASDPNGICSFRVDIDIATCGEIIPLRAINYLFEVFECDVVYIDYVIRGYTRAANGKKIYNDHHFHSIQDFIDPSILENFSMRSDINMPQDNTWQTKLMIKESPPERFLMYPADAVKYDLKEKMRILEVDMRELFHMMH